MNVLVVSGIWPPDVGGPASHAPEVCEYLLEHGHDVVAVTTADRTPEPRAHPVHWVSRRYPRGVRHLVGASRVARLARRADVVYSTGMIGRTTLGAALGGAPVVLKLTTDEVFERSLRWGLFDADIHTFQRARGLRIGALRRARGLALGRAARIVIPSDSLRRLALDWGVAAGKVVLLPNPVEPPPGLEARDVLRRRHGLDGPTLVFAGRLVPQKSVDVALEALRRSPGVSLLLAGDGPHREPLERQARELGLDGRARFLGPQPRRTVFELLRAADAALLSSSWENFPHMAVEALAVGTPVLATEAGGVTEIVRDGQNGLLAPIGDAEALAAAIRRYFDDPQLRERLRAEAVDSIREFAPETVYARLEELLVEAARSR
jgi:glycosyltransferase involved in cell wall biosynthesis